MIPTAVIAFREFFEAFLIVGVFLGISKKLELHKQLEIGLAAGVGIVLSLSLSIATYMFGDNARMILTEENAEMLESYLLIFSGLFISYVFFSLHGLLRKGRGGSLLLAHNKMQQRTFDIPIFFTIIFIVLREGFEIALFTSSVALFSDFMQNISGLLVGFGAASILGLTTSFAYVRIPVGKIFQATEYMIILLGAALTQVGVTKLFEIGFNIHLSDILSFRLTFLPGTDTVFGHFLRGFTGIDRDFSVIRLMIMFLYVGGVTMVFKRRVKNNNV